MIAATINVLQITIMTKIYGVVSIFLNDQENHRTDIEYENSLIIKTVIFQFVNNYSALFYVAFIKDNLEGCTISCMYELEYTVAIVYCSRLFIGNMTEVAIPRFWVYVNQYRLIGKLTGAADPEVEARKSSAEKELFMAQYDWRGTFDDYTEMVLQFGYTTMFVVSFPFAPLLSYLNNYFEIRLDAYRLLFESRRPRPYNVRDIGYWYDVLQAMASISICTNGGVVVFTGNYFNEVSVAMRVWYFTLFTASMFFFKYVLEVSINDVPASVEAQRKRGEFLIRKCLYHVPDEDSFRPVIDGDDPEHQSDGLHIHDEDVDFES
uniref:Anoctamin transmembrane domain-containing protein n=1 Tax=Globisporangium ultimum (strain ATCC 200006 / CBS 805.95 / DAOM BR144) TaxID=431595 RepID=K3WYQ1_GLOUD